MRWEWFPRAGEVLSAGVFYKRFVAPIETVVVVSAQHSITWANAESATNLGVEVEWRRVLDFLPVPDDLYVQGNVALIRSRVTLAENSGIQTSDVRPVPRLDATVRQALPRGFTLSLKGSNLLNPTQEITQGDLVLKSLQSGWAVSGAIGWGS